MLKEFIWQQEEGRHRYKRLSQLRRAHTVNNAQLELLVGYYKIFSKARIEVSEVDEVFIQDHKTVRVW